MLVHIFDLGQAKRHPVKRIKERLFRTFWFPVDNAWRELRALGVSVRHVNQLDRKALECDVLIVNGRSVRFLVRNGVFPNSVACCVHARSQGARLVWFDSRDSAGNCQFDIVDAVDVYLKRQVYRDRSRYLNELYFGRLYSDYYHRHFGVEDPKSIDTGDSHLPFSAGVINDIEPTEVAPTLAAANKVRSAWTCGMEFHWPCFKGTDLVQYEMRRALSVADPRIAMRPEIRSPHLGRNFDLSALFDEKRYSVRSVGYQRKIGLAAAKALRDVNAVCGRVAKHRFYNTLASSKICLSVFGWGEVCYREYEATYCGATILMPDMSDLDVYPDFYRDGEHYIACRWDFADFEEKVHLLLQNNSLRVELAERAQRFLLDQWSAEGRARFAKRFVELITPDTGDRFARKTVSGLPQEVPTGEESVGERVGNPVLDIVESERCITMRKKRSPDIGEMNVQPIEVR